MAAPYKASVVLATSNTAILPASLCNDLLILVSNSNQSMSFGASNVATWLRINSNGFVGVGKSNPGYTLDIAGNVNFAGALTSNGVPFVSGGGGAFSNNGSNLYVLSPSNVGIHVATPLAALHVASNARIDGDLTLMRNIQFGGVYVTPGGTATNASQLILATSNIQGYSNLAWGGSNGTQYSIMSNTSNDAWRWVSGTASNEVARLTGDGRLGLGTAAPASTVHLGTAFASNVMVTLCNTVTGGRPASIGLSNSGEMVVSTASNHSFVLMTSNIERMRVTSNGLVGIGTAAPACALTVLSSSATIPLNVTGVGTGGGGTPVAQFFNSNGVPVVLVGSHPNSNIYLNYTSNTNTAQMGVYGGTTSINITSNGIGVGTSAPTTMLHMFNGQLTMENTGYAVGASNVISFRHYNGSTGYPTPQVMSYLPGNNMADLRFYTGSNTSQTLAMTVSGSNVDVVGSITSDSLLYRNRPSFYAEDWTTTGGVSSSVFWTDLRNSSGTSTTLTNGSNIRTTVAGFYHLEARAAYGDNWGFGGVTANIATLNFYTGSSTSCLIGTSYQSAKYTTVVYLPANTTFNVQEQYNGNTYHNKILGYTSYSDTTGVGFIRLRLISF